MRRGLGYGLRELRATEARTFLSDLLPLVAGAAFLAFAAVARPAVAGESGNRLAYDYALRCFVVNKDDGAAAKVAYDAAITLGHQQGLSETRINADFKQAISLESIRFARSDDYRTRLMGECRKLGMAN